MLVSFDRYKGGVRNHDVLAYGTADCGEVIVGVEGKINESLDRTLAGKYEAARKRKAQGKNSNLDQRIDDLLGAIVGTTIAEQPELGRLRYQLFSAIAGTIAAATPTTAAVAVVVHLIRSDLAKPEKFAATRESVAEFSDILGLVDRPLIGPIRLKKPIGHARLALPIWLAVIETGVARADPLGRTRPIASKANAKPSSAHARDAEKVADEDAIDLPEAIRDFLIGTAERRMRLSAHDPKRAIELLAASMPAGRVVRLAEGGPFGWLLDARADRIGDRVALEVCEDDRMSGPDHYRVWDDGSVEELATERIFVAFPPT